MHHVPDQEDATSSREIVFFEPRILRPGQWQSVPFIVRANRRRFAPGYGHYVLLPTAIIVHRLKHGLLIPVRQKGIRIPETHPVWLVRSDKNHREYQVLFSQSGMPHVESETIRLWKGILPDNRLYGDMTQNGLNRLIRQGGYTLMGRSFFRPVRRHVTIR